MLPNMAKNPVSFKRLLYFEGARSFRGCMKVEDLENRYAEIRENMEWMEVFQNFSKLYHSLRPSIGQFSRLNIHVIDSNA